MEIGQLAAKLVLVLFAAVIGEATIEFLLQPVVNLVLAEVELNKPKRTLVFNFISAAFGVFIAFGFNLRLFELLGGAETLTGLDAALTGIMLGRGSNYIHGLLTQFFTRGDFYKEVLYKE